MIFSLLILNILLYLLPSIFIDPDELKLTHLLIILLHLTRYTLLFLTFPEGMEMAHWYEMV